MTDASTGPDPYSDEELEDLPEYDWYDDHLSCGCCACCGCDCDYGYWDDDYLDDYDELEDE